MHLCVVKVGYQREGFCLQLASGRPLCSSARAGQAGERVYMCVCVGVGGCQGKGEGLSWRWTDIKTTKGSGSDNPT